MADDKDKPSDPPAENPIRLPIKKRRVSQQTLPVNRDTQDSNNEAIAAVTAFQELNVQPVPESDPLQFFADTVLEATAAPDVPSPSDPSGRSRRIIKPMQRYMNMEYTAFSCRFCPRKFSSQSALTSHEKSHAPKDDDDDDHDHDHDDNPRWGQTQKRTTRTALASSGNKTEKTTAAKEQQERPEVAPANIQKGKAEPSSTTLEDSPIPSWGDVSPASLVNKWVKINIRGIGEDDYVTFLIADYDAETEMHQLVTAQSKKELKDPCTWIDIRHFSGEDIVWQDGNPGFPTRKCFLKPGQTTLHATSTAREKKQIKEVGKTASGIPIIKKVDNGKSIAQ